MAARILTVSATTIAAALVSLSILQSAGAAEPGNVPADQLAQFGIGQMEVLSDTQGGEIRGSGFFYFGYGHHYYLGRHPYAYSPYFGYHGLYHGYGKYGYGKHGYGLGHGHGKGRYSHSYLFGSKGYRRLVSAFYHGHGHHHD